MTPVQWNDSEPGFPDFLPALAARATMDFGGAITALKMGQKVQRAGWNGKGMHLFLVVPHEPDLDPYITMFTAQQRYQAGWLASQADMLADDWVIVNA